MYLIVAVPMDVAAAVAVRDGLDELAEERADLALADGAPEHQAEELAAASVLHDLCRTRRAPGLGQRA